jgi:uncharacterized membrane protein YqjE
MLNALSNLPVFLRLRSGARVVADGMEHRLELTALDAADARAEAGRLAVVAASCAVFATLAGFALNALVIALAWDTPHRILAISLLAFVQLMGAAVLALQLRKRFAVWAPFRSTLDELRKDRECLRDVLRSPEPTSPIP